MACLYELGKANFSRGFRIECLDMSPADDEAFISQHVDCVIAWSLSSPVLCHLNQRTSTSNLKSYLNATYRTYPTRPDLKSAVLSIHLQSCCLVNSRPL